MKPPRDLLRGKERVLGLKTPAGPWVGSRDKLGVGGKMKQDAQL